MQMKRTFFTMALSAAAGVCLAQSVTVNSAGGADHTSLSAALAAVQANAAGPDVITIQNAGPFLEAGQLLINGDTADNELTIQASPGIRPVVVSSFNGDGAIFVNKNNKTTIKDLILLPGMVATAADAPQSAIRMNDETVATGMEMVLQNILISSNNGANQPVASLNGLTQPTIDPLIMRSFRDEGVYVESTPTTMVFKVTCEDVIVSGLFGDQGSDAFRTLQDGVAGSEFTVGPGCVASYITGGATNAALQPGGNEGVTLVQVKGTALKPVKFINNTMNGIACTATVQVGSTKQAEWLIISGNTLAGFTSLDSDENWTFTNVTIANNGGPTFVTTSAFAGAFTMTGVIVAGNGTEVPANTINVSTTAAGTLVANNSAFVLAGAYKLDTTNFDLDGLDDNTPTSNVTKTAVISADPDFASLVPTDPNFAVVRATAYATAGPGSTALVGGGSYNPTAAVADWSIY